MRTSITVVLVLAAFVVVAVIGWFAWMVRATRRDG